MQQNTPAFVTLSPAPITMTISPMMTPFSTQLDHLSPFSHCLLYAIILKSTTAYQALHALPYFSANNTLTQLTILFQIYSTLRTLFTRPPGAQQVPLTPSGPLPLRNLLPSSPSSNVSLRYENLPLTFYTSRDSTTLSPSFLPPSSMLFSPPLFFRSQKANNQLSMQITPFPLAYPRPTRLPPRSPIAPLPSISAKVCSLTEMIQSLKALLKERTSTPPLSQPSCPLQLFHPPPPSYHQADLHLPDPLPFSASYTNKVLSYLPPGWPLPLPPAMFTPHWEQLQNGILHLPPILWNPFQSLLQPHQPQAWMIVSIPHESYPLPSPFPQDPVTWAQSFQLDVSHVNPPNTFAPTVPIIIVPSMDKLPLAIPTTNALNFVAPTVSSVVTPESSAPRPCPQTMTPS